MLKAFLFVCALCSSPLLAQLDTVIINPITTQRISAGESVLFEAIATGDRSDEANFYWELNEGANGTFVADFEGNGWNYTFEEPGEYTMFCEAFVGDDLADDTPAERTIIVSEEAGDPVVTTISSPQENAAFTIGSLVSFSAEASGGAGEPYGFSWGVTTPGGGLVFFGEQNFEVTVQELGSYIVTCRATDADGVRADEQARITFQVVEAIDIDTEIVSPTGVSLSLTAGDSQTFTAEASGADNDASFFWTVSFGGQTVADFTGNPYTYRFDQAGRYTVQVAAEADGIRDSTPDQIVVNVEEAATAPETEITLPSTPSVTIDTDETVRFEATSPGGDGTETFAWEINFDGETVHTASGSSMSYTFPEQGAYGVWCAASRDGLTDQTPAIRAVLVSDVILEEVNTFITEPGVVGSIEVGTTLTFAATATGGDGSEPTFYWSLSSDNGNAPFESNDNPVNYTFDEPGTYVMSVAAQIGDQRDPSPASRTIVVFEDTGSEAPDTSIDPSGLLSLDVGDSQTFRASSDVADASFYWRIALNNQTVDERDGSQITVTFDQEGLYEILVAAIANGEQDPSPATVSVRVSEAQIGGIQTVMIVPRSDVSVAPNSEVGFEAYATGANDADDSVLFIWELSLDGELVWESEENPTFFTFEQEGLYTMAVYAEDSDGNFDETPATRMINVTSEGLTAPDTVILQPSADTTVEAGDLITFQAGLASEGSVSPKMDDQVFFVWEIYNETADEEVDYFTGESFQTVFTDSGDYQVACIAVRQGLLDPSPAIRNITVVGDAESIEVNIVEPSFPFSQVPLGDSLTFRAETYPAGSEADIFWEVYPSNGVGQVRTFSGASVDIDFPLGGTYEVIATVLNTDLVVIEDDHIVDVVELEAEITQPTEYEISIAVGTTLDFTGELVGRTLGQTPQWWFQSQEQTVVGSGNSLSYTFNEPGFFVLLFGIPGDETVSGLPIIDGRVIIVGESVPFDIAITSPRDFGSFSIYETFDIRAQLIGAASSDVEITWVVEGEAFRGPLVIEDIQVDEPGDYLVEIFADHKVTGEVVEDATFIEIYDPGEDLYAEITSPVADLYVDAGDSVYFRGFYDDEREGEEISQQWKVRNVTTGDVVERATLGLYTFETEGSYEVTYQVFGEGRSSNIDTRTISVALPLSFGVNITPEQAAALNAGNFTFNDVDGDRYFLINLKREVQDLAVEVNASEPVIVDVFNWANQDLNSLLATFRLDGQDNFVIQDLAQGTYLLRIAPEDTAAAKQKALSVSMSLDVAKPALFFTDVTTDTQFETTVGLLNPSNAETRMEIVAYDTQGNVLERANRTLKGNGKLASTLKELFKTDATKISWLAVNADRRICGFSNTKSRDKSQSYAITATTTLSSELFVPHIAIDTNTWYTRANVINGQANEVVPKLVTANESFDITASKSFNKDGFDFINKLGGSIPETAKWASVGEQGGKVTLAGNEVFGTKDNTNQVAGLNLSDLNISNPSFTFVRRNLYFTHVAKDRNSFWTGITLVNTANTENTIRIEAFDDDGSSAGASTIVMAAGEKRVGLSDTILSFIDEPEKVSWFVVENDGGITGYTLFGTLDTKRLAGFEPASFLSETLTFPISLNPEGWAGISVINPNDAEVTLEFTLYNNNGGVLSTVQRALPAKNKFLNLMPALFNMESLPANAGWVSCKATGGPIAGFQLFGSNSGDNMAAIKADP